MYATFQWSGRVARSLSRREVLGKKLWGFGGGSDSERMIRDAFARCLLDGEPQQAVVTSRLAGRTEHWECRYIPCVEPAAVLVVAYEVFPGKTPVLSASEKKLLRKLSHDETPQEIAADAGLRVGTVHAQIARLRDRLGCRTTHGAVIAAARMGLLK